MARIPITSPFRSAWCLSLLASMLLTSGRPEAARSLTALPVLAYQPETSLMFGAGASLAFPDTAASRYDRPGNLGLLLIYTLKKQTTIAFEPDLYPGDGGIWQVKLESSYMNFPESYFGIGRDTREEDEETFTFESLNLEPFFIKRVFSRLGLGIKLHYRKSSILKIEDGGALIAAPGMPGAVTGSRGGVLFGTGVIIDWDTRDNIFSAYTGSWYQLRALRYWSDEESDFDYDSYAVDLRRYFRLGNGHVLAFQLYGEAKDGIVPFYELPHLGWLRGILESRFRDKWMGMAQAEYRFGLSTFRPFGWDMPFSDRLFVNVFAAAGDLSCSADHFSLGDLKYSAGFGLRFMVDPVSRLRIRFDLGLSEYGIYPYFQVNETF